MENEELLPKPQTDLPLPEKEIPATTNVKFSILKSKFFIGFVAFSLLLAFLAGGFILGKNSVLKELNPTSPTNPTIPPKDPVVYDPTADWQTFESADKSYSIKYPSGWTPLQNERLVRFFPPGITIKNGLGPSDPNSEFISIYPTEFNPLDCKGDCPINYTSEKIIIGKYSASKTTGLEGTIGGGCGCNYESIIINYKNQYFIFTVYSKGNSGETGTVSKENQEIFDQILSTFKFTDSEEIPSAKDKDVFCTQEAKLCPDGSYVGRTGPKCEFTPCPTQ